MVRMRMMNLMKMNRAQSPWANIESPSNKSDLNSILVSGYAMPDGVSAEWVRFPNGAVGLSVRFPQYEREIRGLPSFKSLDLAFRQRGSDGNSYLQLALIDQSMAEIFLDLCYSVLDVISDATALTLLSRVLTHLEKWRKLLSSGGQLSKNAQKGLIGELLFLRDEVMAVLGGKQAVQSWSGPDDSPRDFTVGQTFFEVKANRGAQEQTVIISSENQLAYSDDEQLYLCVIGINENPSRGDSLSKIVDTVRAKVAEDPVVRHDFDSRLLNAGYSDSVDYSDTKWSYGSFSYYVVNASFPRLTPADIPLEVSEVSYRLDLSKLSNHQIDEEELIKAIRGQNGR